MSEMPVLEVEDLRVDFQTRRGPVRVVHGIGLSVARGQTLGIVGESGCGKSMTALALMRLVPNPPGRITGGRIVLNGEDLVAVTDERMRSVRGRHISMVFQEPMTALNPVFSIGEQIAEVLRRHAGMDRQTAWAKAENLLRQVNIPEPGRRLREFPHQLSGGMRQRVMIAMAIACGPDLLIADEPTTALDVTVQAQIFDLLKEIQQTRGMSMLLITHDFGAIGELADHVIVMYAGHKVEEGPVRSVVRDPRHPYTQGLLRCVPEITAEAPEESPELTEIPGSVPSLFGQGSGCPFAPRCPHADRRCHDALPEAFLVGSERTVRCWLAEADQMARG